MIIKHKHNTLTIADEFDEKGELKTSITPDLAYTAFFYMTRDEVKQHRDHLTKVLEDE